MATMRVGIATAIATALLLQGCVQTTPKLDRQFGSTVRANLAAQVLDPGAAANTNPAKGIDGRAAKSANERYERSFSNGGNGAPPPLVNAK